MNEQKLDRALTAYAASPTAANRETIRAACVLDAPVAQAQKSVPDAQDDWYAAANWLRNHYQDYATIGDTCEAMESAAPAADMSAHLECWSCKKPYTAAQRLDADGMCPHCDVEIELDDSDYAAMAADMSAPTDEALLALLDGYARDGTRGYQHYVERIIAWADARAAAPVSGPTELTELKKFQIVAGCCVDDMERLHSEFGFPEDQPIDADDMIEAIRELQAAANAHSAAPVSGQGATICKICEQLGWSGSEAEGYKFYRKEVGGQGASELPPLPSPDQQTTLHPGRQSNLEDAIERASTEMQDFDTEKGSP